MDTSVNALVGAANAMADARSTQAVQVSVLKQALNAQESAAMALLQALPGPQPLANAGPLGTRLNTFA